MDDWQHLDRPTTWFEVQCLDDGVWRWVEDHGTRDLADARADYLNGIIGETRVIRRRGFPG